MNRVQLVGTLAHDPEIEVVGKRKTAVCKLDIYTDRNCVTPFIRRNYDIIRIVTVNAFAQECYKYLRKNDIVAVEGALIQRQRTLFNEYGEPINVSISEVYVTSLELVFAPKKTEREITFTRMLNHDLKKVVEKT